MVTIKAPLPRGAALLVPIWLALLGAALEVVALSVQKQADPLLRISEDFVWMAPLALFTIVLPIVALAIVIGRLRSEAGFALAVLGTSATVALNLFLAVPHLAHYAALLLAAGVGVQITRLSLRDPAGVTRLARRTIVPVVLMLVAGGGAVWYSLRPSPGPAAASAARADAPNVLLITLDTVRAANLGAYGYSRPTTPNLDRFAARGTVFERALTSSPWTLPSHGSMFTGRWAHELSANYTAPLDGAHPTLAEHLGAHGYTSAGFAANLGYCSHETGLGRGFHHYEDYPRSPGQIASSSTLVRTIADNFRLRAWLRNDEHLNRVTAAEINERALAWISTHRDGPFFMFLNYFDAHEPYLPPAPYDTRFGPGRRRGKYSPLHRWLWDPKLANTNLDEAERREEIDAYDGALAYLDSEVGRFLDDLERRGVLARTVVIITADHGEEFGEHGTYEHGYSLYRAGVHVPLIVVAPGSEAPRRVSTAVSIRSLAATVVDLVGLSGTPFPGPSLAPFLRGGSGNPTGDAFAEPLLAEVSFAPGHPAWFPTSKGDMTSVAHDGVRYIRNGDGTEELYDFAGDPWEARNLAAQTDQAARLASSRALLDSLMRRPSIR